ncbi:MAG TPA: TadE/TadG family type IV pilus assembly protein [Acetobacteraceae bacterium]|jgi:Flp pilus assembly protein TadG|nr:TadE/TadG family type IV pilus assembly protein [Acetobacteraceae bacterium]
MTAGSRQSFFALFHRDPRGTAAVEFALIAPVLFLLILGITQFGITLNDYEMLTGGTEAAARQFSMSRGSSTPSSSTTTALYNAASNLTQASITFTLKVNGTACTGDSACQTALTNGQGQPATITTSYPCNLTVYGYNFAPGCTLNAQSTEIVE